MYEGIGTPGFDLSYGPEDNLAPKLFGTEIQIVSTRCAQFWRQMGMCRLWIIKKFRGQKIIVYISRLPFFARVQCAHNHLRLSIMIQHLFKTFEFIHKTFCAHIIVIRIEYITSCFSMIYEILSNNMISWVYQFHENFHLWAKYRNFEVSIHVGMYFTCQCINRIDHTGNISLIFLKHFLSLDFPKRRWIWGMSRAGIIFVDLPDLHLILDADLTHCSCTSGHSFFGDRMLWPKSPLLTDSFVTSLMRIN